MQIELTKRADGAGTLRCIRGDRSITWRPSPRPLHDLTRYAVEAVLQFSDGYWGRIANGSMTLDHDGAQPTGEAALSLRLSQKFDVELAGAIAWHASEMPASEVVTEASLERIRAYRDHLFRRWFELLPGEPLTLPWPASMENDSQ